MINFDLMRYGTHALVGYGSLLAYDVLIEGYKLDGGFAMSDAASFAVSTVVSNLAYDLLSSVLPYINENNISGMITKPVLNGIIYMYLFDYMTNKRYPGSRDATSAFLVGSIGCVISYYIENPLLSLFGIRSHY